MEVVSVKNDRRPAPVVAAPRYRYEVLLADGCATAYDVIDNQANRPRQRVMCTTTYQNATKIAKALNAHAR